jgi:hypothetical protein
MDNIKIEVISGVERACLALNNTRVAGPKPWGGGRITNTFVSDQDRILDALNIKHILEQKDKEIERLREGLKCYDCDCPIDDEENCEVGDWQSLSCGYRARKALEGKE